MSADFNGLLETKLSGIAHEKKLFKKNLISLKMELGYFHNGPE